MNSKEMMSLPSQKESLYMLSKRMMMAGLRESQREVYKTVLTFESVDEILECDHSSESY